MAKVVSMCMCVSAGFCLFSACFLFVSACFLSVSVCFLFCFTLVASRFEQVVTGSNLKASPRLLQARVEPTRPWWTE